MSNTTSFRLTRLASTADVVQSLERNGIAVLERFVEGDALKALRAEVSSLFGGKNREDLSFDTGAVKRLYREELRSVLGGSPELRGREEMALVREVCTDFFGQNRWELGGLFAMRYRDRMPTNERFHIDPCVSVKFFYYLDDVTADCGPFTYCLGSHREGYFRMRCSALEGAPGPQVVPDEEVRNVTPIEAPAGSLLVFNAIGIHRAGDIRPGHSRFSATFHYVAKRPARTFRERVSRVLRRLPELRGTETLDELCAYERKHQSRAYHYT